MARRGFNYDYSLFEYNSLGRLMYDGQKATPAAQRAYNRNVGTRRSLQIEKSAQSISSKFRRSSFLRGERLYVPKWAEPMTVKGGKNPEMRYRRVEYTQYYELKKGKYERVEGGSKKVRTSKQWGTRVDRGNSGTIRGFEGLVQHLLMASHLVNLTGESFRMLTAERALKVFQTSFLKHMFYTQGSTPWPALSEVTKKIRRRRKSKSGPVLVEYGDLANSFKIERTAKALSVYTDKVAANKAHGKKYTNCYGGWHNEGTGTYWNTGIRYKKRQFMGHSSYLDPETDPFMRKMCKLYLFDEVFLSPK